MNLELLYVDADLSKKVVTSHEVSVMDFELDNRTLATKSTATIFTSHIRSTLSYTINYR